MARSRSTEKSAKPAPAQRQRWQRIVKWLLLLSLLGTALAACGVAFIFWWYGRNGLPAIDKLGDYHPTQVSVVVDKNNKRIGELYQADGRRTFVAYDRIPKIVTDAFVAAEDQSFWTHGGIDYVGMVRALITNLKSNRSKQGASTITQQVVKTFLLSPEKTFRRKVQEIILARRIEKNLSKEEIITLYLNQINLGHGRYGIQEASRFYFGKDVENVNPGEAAVLAALPKSPTNISPRTHPDRAKERQIYVLRNLVSMNKLSAQEGQKWIDAPITLVKDPYPELNSAPEWIELAKQQLIAARGKASMSTLGATIVTTVDPSIQKTAQAALQKALRGIDKRLKIGIKRKHHAENAIADELKKFTKRHGGNLKANSDYPAIVTKVSDTPPQLQVDAGGWTAVLSLQGKADERYNQPRDDGTRAKPSERFSRGDEISIIVGAVDAPVADEETADEEKATSTKRVAEPSVNRAEFAPGPQGAVIVMDIKTRKVRALVGGYASEMGGFNRATMAKRQAGSSFKPIVYATAIAAGIASPGRVVNDAPEVYNLWKPQNFNKGVFEGPVRLRYALAKSINTVAIKVCHEAGIDNVRAMASKLGIATELPNDMSIALGSGVVTPLEMANAFATLGAGGMYAPPRFIESIDGQAQPVVAATQAIAPEVAYVTVDMMRSVIEEGTGHRAKSLGLTIAGKTGTSNDARDTWFVGMTPEFVVAVWLGNDNNESMGSETGGTTAVPVFVDIVKTLGLSKHAFDRPANVVEASIDKATGLLAAPGAPAASIYNEVYVAGTAPTEVAPVAGDVTSANAVTSEYDEAQP
jgi:penicillin-binding protein 1A